jgi:glycosyltransferase involved in cell wall biosynthesis
VRELLDDESAVLVPPGDVQALASALRDLTRDEKRRASLAAVGHQVYEEHASRRVLGQRWLSSLDGNALRK